MVDFSPFFQQRGPGLDAQDLNPDFASRLDNAVTAAEQATGQHGVFSSLARTTAKQAELYYNYTHGIGGQGLAAPPGHSLHEKGLAADLQAGPVLDWMHHNAGQYGLTFLPGHSGAIDPGHIQLAGAQTFSDPTTVWDPPGPTQAHAAALANSLSQPGPTRERAQSQFGAVGLPAPNGSPTPQAATVTAPSPQPASPGTDLASALGGLTAGLAGQIATAVPSQTTQAPHQSVPSAFAPPPDTAALAQSLLAGTHGNLVLGQ